MSRLISIQASHNLQSDDENCCHGCGRTVENSIQLTNLSAAHKQTYGACPFCFSKLSGEEPMEEVESLETLKNRISLGSDAEEQQASPEEECPHHLGYLKKRPKNVSIPDSCLTCQKMLECLL